MADHRVDFGVVGPDIGEINGLAVAVVAERVAGQVNLHRAGNRTGDDERWGCQVVDPAFVMDASIEITVARQDGRYDQGVLINRRLDSGCQRT